MASVKLAVKSGADFVRGADWQPVQMTRKGAERYAERTMDPAMKRAGFKPVVSETIPAIHGGCWFRINYVKSY